MLMTLSADITKLNFYSGDPIDKIVAQGSGLDAITIVNDGNSGAYDAANIVSLPINNSYGEKCFVRYNWSIDLANFNSPLSHIDYTYSYNTVAPAPITSNTFNGLKAGVSVGVSKTQIIFRTANGYHGTVTDDGVTISFTPISLTFTINYAVFTMS